MASRLEAGAGRERRRTRVRRGRWRRAAAAVGLVAGLLPAAAQGLASIDFATRTGQFSLDSTGVDFGSDLAVTAARDNAGIADPSVLGLRVSLDPVVLTGVAIPFGSGITLYQVDLSRSYQVRLHGVDDAPEVTARFDPGEFIVVFATGVLSPSLANGLSDVTGLAPGAHPAWDALVAGESWDWSATFSAAGQDIHALLQDGQTVHGSVAGNLSVLSVMQVPEPGSLALVLLGLTGLAWQGGRRRD